MPAVPGGGKTAVAVTAELTNDQLGWRVERAWRTSETDSQSARNSMLGVTSVEPVPGSPAEHLLAGRGLFSTTPARYKQAELVPPLLLALEDADRFVVAHVLLSRLTNAEEATTGRLADGRFVVNLVGMKVVLTGAPSTASIRFTDESEAPTCVAYVEPDQLPAVRDAWHRRLDRTVVSVAYRDIAIATGMLPVLCCGIGLARRIRRRSRVRSGSCPVCGYDLRARPRCPECGAVPRGKGQDEATAALDLHALAAASLLLCVATAGLWVRSYGCDLFDAAARVEVGLRSVPCV